MIFYEYFMNINLFHDISFDSDILVFSKDVFIDFVSFCFRIDLEYPFGGVSLSPVCTVTFLLDL